MIRPARSIINTSRRNSSPPASDRQEKDYQALRRFAQSHGLTVTGTHPNRLVLNVTGTVGNIEKAFHVQMRVYPHPTEPRTFYAPDMEPALDLEVPVLNIAGLSDYARPHPSSLHARAGGAAAQRHPQRHRIGIRPVHWTGFQGRLCAGGDADRRGPIGRPGGIRHLLRQRHFQYLALPAGGLTNTSVTLTNVAIDQPLNTLPGSNTIEVALDIDMAICMAPGLSNLFVYEAPNGDSLTPADDLFNRIATDNSAQQISCSWSGFTDGTIEQVFQEFAAQGQSFFIASGDSGAYVNPQGNPDLAPVDNPYVTSVGGTTLFTSGARGAWSSETTWNWFTSQGGAKTNGSTGGISPDFSIPSWQQPVSMAANQGSATCRNFPDVALTADQVYAIANDGIGYSIGGTSCAAPLWAGFMALVNEQNAAVGNAPAGFFNPALYALGQGADYTNCFHDITTGNNTNLISPNLYFAVPGYDLCTGWGTPAGSNLIHALAVPADVLEITPNNSFSISTTPGGPFGRAPRIFLLTNAGATALNWTLGNPAAWLSASPGAGTLPAGGFAIVTVSLNPVMAATLSLGLHSTNLWFTNQSDGVAQSRLFTLILAEPQLVQNGGFETGDFTGWTLVGDTIESNVIYDAVEDGTNFPLAVHSGTYGACLGDDKPATLSQSLATVPGQNYLLSLWLDNPTNGPGREFLVNWNTNDVTTNNIYGISSPPAFGWTNLQFVLLAAGSGTVLEFGAQNDPPNYFGLDDVSVTPIPPPAFQSAAASDGGSVTLTWLALAGVSYQLQYTTSLSAANWFNLGPPITAISAATAASDVQPADPQRFYRVMLAP